MSRDSREVRIPIAIGTGSPKVGKSESREVRIPIAIGTGSPEVDTTNVCQLADNFSCTEVRNKGLDVSAKITLRSAF